MTPNELQEILHSDKKLTVQEVKNIIGKLKDDTVKLQNDMLQKKCDTTNKDLWISNYGFYNGERNAFYVCLDLLDKVGKDETSVFEDIKTGLEQAIEYEKGNKNGN